MIRHGHLFERVATFENLVAAWHEARIGKTRKPAVARFGYAAERELHRIRAELLDGAYRFGPYRAFHVCDTKPRRILAAPFRDRVVHHAICRVVAPILDATLIGDTFACREGKGTIAAMKRVREFVREVPDGYALKADVLRHFDSIDRELLVGLLARKIKDARLLGLPRALIDSAPPGGAGPGKGIPIGSLTSQTFANQYLSPVDHAMKEALGVGRYARYVDDIVIVDASKARLLGIAACLRQSLAALRLQLHARKITAIHADSSTPSCPHPRAGQTGAAAPSGAGRRHPA